jgi:ArsR family transcriptional regulator, arsenate/arsenite/antimonite-responsive transcriptional repressor
MSEPVKHLETVFKLLAEPNRLRILYSLGLDCRPVTQIVEATGLSQTNVSFHLRLLREAGLVRPERRGPFVYYCLPDSELLEVLERFGDWVERCNSGVHKKLSAAGSAAKAATVRRRTERLPQGKRAGRRV